MKKTNTLLLALIMISTPAFAKSAGSAKTVDTASYSRSAPQSGGSGGFGLGVTTFSALGVAGLTTGGISTLLPIGNHFLQTTLVMAAAGAFTFGLNSMFKATVAGSSDSGFHIGGGLGLGVVSAGLGGSAFFFNLGGVMGIHHEISSKIQMSFDAGPVIGLTPAPVSFGIMPFSTTAGFSVHYFL